MFRFLLPHRVQPAQMHLPYRGVESVMSKLKALKNRTRKALSKAYSVASQASSNLPLGRHLTQGIERQEKYFQENFLTLQVM